MSPRTLHLELHCHTVYSMDGLISFDSLISTAKRVGLDAIAITDHDTIEGAKEFQKTAKAKNLDLQIIVGEEKTLKDGSHFIGLFLQEPIQSGDLGGAIQEIQDQAGICLIPHPFRRKDGLFRDGLERLAMLTDINAGFELFNAKCGYRENKLAQEVLLKSGLCPFAGSDAHYESDLGESLNLVPWQGDLRSTVDGMFRRQSKFEIHGRQQTPTTQERAYAPLYYKFRKLVRLPKSLVPAAKQGYRWYRNRKYGIGLKSLIPLYSHA
jgi:predicted metal-dependent phosphoesterase TrpH